jgi:hypothetical protein
LIFIGAVHEELECNEIKAIVVVVTVPSNVKNDN